MLFTTPATGISCPGVALKASSGGEPPQRRRCHPVPAVSIVGGGELQPRKKEPLAVVMLNRGAPAPQWEPRGSLTFAPGLRMSYPSSVKTKFLGSPLRSAPAAATFAVGPVFASSRPSTFLSFGSPVGQAGSVKDPLGFLSPVVVVAAAVGQPIPPSHADWTRSVSAGSKAKGTT